MALPVHERLLFMEAFALLGVMRAAVLTLPFKRLTRALRHSHGFEKRPHIGETQRKRAVVIGSCVEKAAAHTPWESACLVKSLAAAYMLRRRKIAGCFCLGVQKRDHADTESLKAHAWTVCGPEVLTGKEGYSDFTVISVFEWEGR